MWGWPLFGIIWCHPQTAKDSGPTSKYMAYPPKAWASYQIRKIAGAHAPGMLGTFSLPPRVSDPDMHHGTCVTHVPWYMPGSLTGGFLWIRRRGKTFPAFPAHAQPAILRIWQEAHECTDYVIGTLWVRWVRLNACYISYLLCKTTSVSSNTWYIKMPWYKFAVFHH